MDYDKLLRQHRKKPLFNLKDVTHKLDLGRKEIKKNNSPPGAVSFN